jgi:hypothetical protein
MAEERTLGLARADDEAFDEPSKEELQRRMDEARDSISHTVTEIKETVANQVQAVKETLDWREQFKRRPVAWSVGAAGVGFMVGYGLAAVVKGERRDDELSEYYARQERSYAAQPIIAPSHSETTHGNGHDGPGLFQKLTHTPVYGKVRDEVGNVGDALLDELGKTAKQFVLPALMTSLRNFIGGYLPESSKAKSAASMTNESSRSRTESASGYQPSLDRGNN